MMNARGFTFIEILVASMIASVVAGGTMMAFVTASRINNVQNHAALAEANVFASQALEELRNRTASDDSFFAAAAAGWQTVALPPAAQGGTESILNQGARRCRQIQPGCGGNCWQVDVQVCWGTGACNCP